MVAVKKFTIPTRQLGDLVSQLQSQGYNSCVIIFPGNPAHRRAGLRDDWVLVRAWRYKPRPDRQKR